MHCVSRIKSYGRCKKSGSPMHCFSSHAIRYSSGNIQMPLAKAKEAVESRDYRVIS